MDKLTFYLNVGIILLIGTVIFCVGYPIYLSYCESSKIDWSSSYTEITVSEIEHYPEYDIIISEIGDRYYIQDSTAGLFVRNPLRSLFQVGDRFNLSSKYGRRYPDRVILSVIKKGDDGNAK